MQIVVSADEMRWCDETAIRKYGIPSLLLMENAGREVARVAEDRYGPVWDEHVVVVCGKGNNGGDGFVVARHLHNAGAIVTVVMMAKARELRGDAKTNFQILQRVQKADQDSIFIEPYSKALLKELHQPEMIIDAMFGTGFSGAVREPYASVISWMNSQPATTIAVDIPSGVDGTTGTVENIAVQADATVTFGSMKTGLLCNQARDHVGEIWLADIGIPNVVFDSPKLATYIIEPEDVHSRLPLRSSTAHKYNVGKVLVLAGSKGYTGAAALCASAALKGGAGAVILGTPETVYPILARKLSETIVTPLPATSDGTLSLAALEAIRSKLQWADVVVVGPGISLNPETQELIKKILSEYKGNIVVDADALQAVASIGLKRLRQLKGSFVLTPHAGEFSRLTDVSSNEVERHRIAHARDIAKLSHATIVLKGASTATGTSDGKVYLNTTGNPGMATIGSGDVLAGLIGSLWAQGMDRDVAAFAGVFLHGLAGDIAKEQRGERSLVAHDLIDCLPNAFKYLEVGESTEAFS